MNNRCIIKEVKAAAAKHLDNAVVQALIAKLNESQQVAAAHSQGDNRFNPLAGYEQANREVEGFNLMINPRTDLFSDLMKDAYIHHEVAIITDCLVTVLSTLGERL